MLNHILTLTSIVNDVANRLKTLSEALEKEAEQKTQDLKTMFKADVEESALKAEAKHIVRLKKRAELLDRLAGDLMRSSAKLTEIVEGLEEVLWEMVTIAGILVHEDVRMPVLNDLVNKLTVVITRFLGLSKKAVSKRLKDSVIEKELKEFDTS